MSSFRQSVQIVIKNPNIPVWNKLRLVILYALRYQKTQANNVASLINLMLENGVSREDARVRSIPPFVTSSGIDISLPPSWSTSS